PPGMPVKVDGQPAGTSPLRLKVAPGKHVVRVEVPKFEPAEQEATAELTKEVPVSLTLKPTRRIWSARIDASGAPLLASGLSLWRTASGIVALDAKAERKWEYNPAVGTVAAMQLHGETLLTVHALGANSAVAAVKVEDGKELWRL